MQRLLDRNLWRHWRLKRVDDHLDHTRFAGRQRFFKNRPDVAGLLDRESETSTGFGKLGEIDLMKLTAVFRIAEEHDLLPFDLAERVVFDDHDEDRQIVLDRGCKLAHEHRESAVAYKSDRLPLRKCDLRGDGVWQGRRHGRQRARTTKFLPLANIELARDPGRDRS